MAANEAQSKTLTPKEESQLIQMGQSDSPRRDEALTRLFDSGMPMITALAKQTHRRTPNDVLYEDLEAAAQVGFMLAIKHFNPLKGSRLSTYARLWVQNQLAEEIRRTRWSVGIPERTYKHLGLLMTHTGTLTSKLQRTPTIQELAAEVHMDVTEVRKILAWSQRDALSLEAPRGDKGDVCLADLLAGVYEVDDADTVDVVAHEAERTDFVRRLADCIAQLPPAETRVLQLRFGLPGERDEDGKRVFKGFSVEPLTRREIAAQLGVSQERTRQIEVAGLDRLQRMPEFQRIATDYAKGRRRRERASITGDFAGRAEE